jgi:hypothetical protein
MNREGGGVIYVQVLLDGQISGQVKFWYKSSPDRTLSIVLIHSSTLQHVQTPPHTGNSLNVAADGRC